jgi:hypothetical protein
LVKANRITGEVIDSLTYTAGEAVTGVGYERMAYDGKWLWLPAQQNVIKVDPVTMAVSGTVALGGTASHRSQSLIWDGHSIYAILSHTSLGTGGIFKINPSTEAVTTVLSGSGAAKTVDTSMDRITLYTLDNDGNGIAYPNKTTPGAGWASATGLQQALVVDPYSIWTGGSDGVERVGISSANYNASSDQTVVGDVVSMIWTGEDNSVWAITTTDETVENASKLRKLVQSGGSIVVAEEFNLGTTFYPIWMTADADSIYVGAWGTGRVAKFAMRKI